MFRLILKRLLLLIPVLIGVTFLVFSILSLAPGDPVLVVLGDNATEEAAEAMRSELGLDKPFLERYVNYIWDLLHGDFGKSYKTKLSVSDQILSRFPNTILLALSSMLIALLLGIPLGILSAKKQYTLLDNVASVGGLISVSMPNFWLGLLLVILFALKLRWLPSQGMGEGTGPMLKSLILPAVTLGTGIMATIMRMTRSSVLETMRQDYVSTARAKGISESQVTTRHNDGHDPHAHHGRIPRNSDNAAGCCDRCGNGSQSRQCCSCHCHLPDADLRARHSRTGIDDQGSGVH